MPLTEFSPNINNNFIVDHGFRITPVWIDTANGKNSQEVFAEINGMVAKVTHEKFGRGQEVETGHVLDIFDEKKGAHQRVRLFNGEIVVESTMGKQEIEATYAADGNLRRLDLKTLSVGAADDEISLEASLFAVAVENGVFFNQPEWSCELLADTKEAGDKPRDYLSLTQNKGWEVDIEGAMDIKSYDRGERLQFVASIANLLSWPVVLMVPLRVEMDGGEIEMLSSMHAGNLVAMVKGVEKFFPTLNSDI